MNKQKDRIGVSVLSRDGVKATVIRYASCEDFTIEFSDGTKRDMHNWWHFVNENFSLNRKYNPVRTSDRLGEVKVMSNGMQATVIKYINSHDMTIMFEDEAIKEHVTWREFDIGNVGHDFISSTHISFNELTLAYYLEPLGFSRVPQKSSRSKELGLFGRELDLYNQSLKIAIEYDGSFTHKKLEKDLSKNALVEDLGITIYRFREKGCPPISGNVFILDNYSYFSKDFENAIQEFTVNVLSQKPDYVNFNRDKKAISDFIYHRKSTSRHLFEEKVMNNGLRCKIIASHDARSITVRFENGVLVSGKSYRAFKNGQICLPEETIEAKRQHRLHMKKEMKNHHIAEIIEYPREDRIVVKFDNGEKAITHWGSFIKGCVSLPSAYAKNHIGESIMQKCGMNATLVSVKNKNHLDVRFDDGTIIKNRKFDDWTAGIIKNPNIRYEPLTKNNRLGEIRLMHCGLFASITQYNGANDVTIKFEDGTVVEHKYYAAFCKGSIANPNVKFCPLKNVRLGESKIMKNGLSATIIAYNDSMDIDVEFENGAIIRHKEYAAFIRGSIGIRNAQLNY